MSRGAVRIGISGWTYGPWRGTFFPAGLAQKRELAYASRQLASIEINGTFYSLQRPSSYGSWHEQTPADFVFAVKAPKFITHIRRLKDVAVPVANFFASGVLRLGEKLGPILWQLPPSLAYEPERLEAFLALLPHDTRAALALARRHDAKVREPWLEPVAPRPVRHALEIRNESFRRPEFVALLRRHGVALVVADTAGKWPLMEDITADFVYVRLHGDEELYVSGYTDAALGEWARKIRSWRGGGNPPRARTNAPLAKKRPGGRDVFVYFDNDVKTRSPYDAMTLAHQLRLGPKPPPAPPVETIAEKPRAPSEWPAYGKRRRPRAAARDAPGPAKKRAG